MIAAVLVQVGADNQYRAAAENLRGMAQESGGLMRLEIADGRAGKKSDARGRHGRRQFERLGEIRRRPADISASGNSLRSPAASSSNISPQISTGTYAASCGAAASRMRVLRLEPLPNSTSAAPGGM